MMEGPWGDLTPDELDQLQWQIARIVLNLPRVSILLGHTRPAATIRGNYLAMTDGEPRVNRLAKEYVNDLFTLSSKEIVDKWGHMEWPHRSALAPMEPEK